MKYRSFGKLDWEVSVLGFGAMRLPLSDKNASIFSSKIDEPEAIRMIRHAIDQGVNYIDTAYTYHGGKSETLLGIALKDGYRDKVKLATKTPPPLIRSKKDFNRIISKQLNRLQTDYIDFFLFHGLKKDWWPRVQDLDMFNWAEDAKSDGRIHHLGFSFHDDFELFKEIIDAYDKWDLCQIQYNYMDIEHQAGTKGLKYAAEKGLAVVVMEPIRGGALSKKPPHSITKLWEGATKKRTPSDWALQWVWNHPEVTVALSGMSTMKQVEENLASADRSGPEVLSNDELLVIDRVREEYKKLSPISCTNCKYCMPCPNNVNIPRIFGLFNEGYMYDDHKRSRFFYREMPIDQQADKCSECHDCEDLCPQNLPISEWLKKANRWLGRKKNFSNEGTS